jgi:inner membrane protein
MLLLGCLRWAEHAQALAIIDNTDVASEPVTRTAAEPYPVNPFHWHAILETPDFYQTAEIGTWPGNSSGSINSDPHADVLYKPADTPAVEAAKRTPLGQVYLDWGTWAVVRDVGPEPIPGPVPGLDPPQLLPNRTWTTVEFTDLRFDYAFLGTRSASARSPLAGWVYIVDARDDAGEVMNGREQR